MLNSRTFDYRIWLTLLVSLVFGTVLNKLMPTLSMKPLFLVALPLGLLSFVVLLTKPKWVLVTLVLSRPLLDNLLNLTKDSGSAALQSVGIGAIFNLTIILLGAFLFFYLGNFPTRNNAVRAWCIFLLCMFVAIWYSQFRFSAIRLHFNYASYFAMFMIPFFVIKTREDFLFWLKLLGVSFIAPIFFANLDLLHGGNQYVDAGMRIKGTFTHPNVLAFYLVLGITVYFYIVKSHYYNINAVILLGIKILMFNMFVLLVATKSRNAWIACVFVFLVYGLLRDKKLLIILLLLIPLSLAIPQVRDRVKSMSSDTRGQDYKGLNSFEWRLRMWKSSFSEIQKKPLQGYGLTSYMPMSAKFSDVGKNGAHNAYLEVLFDSGIFGLLSYIGLLLTPLLMFFKNMRNAINTQQASLWAIAVGYMASYMLICSADNLVYYLVFNWYVWFFIALLLISKRFSYDLSK